MSESLFLLKKRLWHRYFPTYFVKFLIRTPVLQNTSGRLLHVVWFWLGFFVSIVCWKPSTDVAETSILGVAGVLDPHLIIAWYHDLSRSLLSGVSSYKVSEHLWWSWHWLAARDCFALSGELQPRCSRSPSAAFGNELRIMSCECFHLINVSNCLATAWIYYGALCDASWQMVFDNCCHREPYLRCCMSSRLIEMET